jgi:mannosylglycerate hydrolase
MSTDGKQLAVYYHTHWDREWYMPFRSYQVRLAEVVDDILERLENGILPCFMLDGQTVVLEDYLELRPQNRARLQTLIHQNRLSIGPWYVMPDEFLVGGESLIRNLARGMREATAWGCKQFTGYLPDTFGHSADVPTILRQFGIQSAIVWRGVHPASSLFRWQSPSGATVLTQHLTDGYFQMMLQDWTLNESEKAQALDALIARLEAAAHQVVSALLPIGGDHLGPLSEAGHTLLKAKVSRLDETTPERYLAQWQNVPDLPEISGELTDNTGSFLLPGVYSSRMYLKQANRRLEHRLTHQLEPLLALAQVAEPSLRYPWEELDLAWKTLLLNHPHDSICGCSVDAVHRENEVRFDQVGQLADALMNRAMHTLSAYGTPEDWVLFNTGDQPYIGVVPVVEDVADAEAPSRLLQLERKEVILQDEYLHDTQRIPLAHLTKTRRTGWIWAENVPPFSVQVIPKAEIRLPGLGVKAEKYLLQNGHLSVQVETDGTLTVLDEQTGLRYPGLLIFQEQVDQGDSYNSAPVPGHTPLKAQFRNVELIASGPLVGILELIHEIPEIRLTLKTRVRLDAGSPMLQFETQFVNATENHKLQVGFETGKPVVEVQAESHLGVVSRPYDPSYREADHMPADCWKELKTNTGPVQRFFSTNGHSFITEGLCEYEVFGSMVKITLVRAFSHLSKADTGVRGAQAGPPFETPEGQCLNRHFKCRYAWTPTPPSVESLYRLSNQFYGVIGGQSGRADSQPAKRLASLITWDKPELIASACYWLPGQGLVLRLLNTSQVAVTAEIKPRFEVLAAWTVNFLDEPQARLEKTTVTIPAHGVQTVLFAVG